MLDMLMPSHFLQMQLDDNSRYCDNIFLIQN